MPDDALAALVGLHRELDRRSRQAIATPEEARRANTRQRLRMQELDDYLPDVEEVGEQDVLAAGHVSGALTHRSRLTRVSVTDAFGVQLSPLKLTYSDPQTSFQSTSASVITITG